MGAVTELAGPERFALWRHALMSDSSRRLESTTAARLGGKHGTEYAFGAVVASQRQ
jgi:hypothetical protein